MKPIAILVLLSCSLASANEAPRPVVAVIEFNAQGATELQLNAVALGVARGLRQLDVFQVLTAQDVTQLLAVERSRQLLGDSGESSFAPLAASLGTRHLVAGTVQARPDGLVVELRLMDTQDGRVVSQKTLGPAAMEVVAREVPLLAQELMSPLLEAQRGGLLVKTREEGAEVVVDEVLRGSTPLKEPLPLARGAHRLQVRKDGFIAVAKSVRIDPDQVTVEELELVPSADYAEAWKLRHGRLRTGAWIASAVAVGAVGGAFAVDQWAERDFQARFVPWKHALGGEPDAALSPSQQQEYASCVALGAEGCSSQMAQLRGDLATRQYATWGLAGLGVIATGFASYLWLTGEDPNRYSNLVAGVSVGPAPGVALAGSF